ncbi:MAG: DUF4924 family protein [Paludibacteraceae bacterium]|nr:DUF4924 family protein [Paludibacteraceae bacterium]MBQ4391413.1 DUF4924 family protein [Paludibacteraceae bacterium]
MKSKKENIAEYILYLWQIEDYLRAFPEQAESSQELQDLSDMMHNEGVWESGHLQIAKNALSELEDLHNELLDTEAPYRAVIMHIQPALNILKSKTDRPTMSDIEACLTLLYQVMMLRLQKRELTPETEVTVKDATQLLRFLSKTYYDDQAEV